jgi:hypothetical protein
VKKIQQSTAVIGLMGLIPGEGCRSQITGLL